MSTADRDQTAKGRKDPAAGAPGAPNADIGHMHFRSMDEMTRADYDVLQKVHQTNLERLPDLLLDLLDSLGGDAAYPVDRRTHSLQAATRALRDGRDEEYVVVALLHDIGEALGPLNHGEVIAAILRPFISDANYWTLFHHPLFQTYYYGARVGVDPNGRDAYREHPHFARTAEFCALYDEVSFDPDYPNEPIATFLPMIRRILSKQWVPPSPTTS